METALMRAIGILQRHGYTIVDARQPVPSLKRDGFIKFARNGLTGCIKILERFSCYDTLVERIAEAEKAMDECKSDSERPS